MAVFTVHIPRLSPGSAALAGDRVKFVADKFSWPALFFGPLWLVWHRMWWVLAGFILIFTALPVVAGFAGVNDLALSWITIACLVFFAMEAASLRRWSLARRGYALVTVVSARNIDECEVRFFKNWVPKPPLPSAAEKSPPAGSGRKRAPPKSDETGVIGVFPASGARR